VNSQDFIPALITDIKGLFSICYDNPPLESVFRVPNHLANFTCHLVTSAYRRRVISFLAGSIAARGAKADPEGSADDELIWL